MAFNIPTINTGLAGQRKSQEQLQAEALQRQQKGQTFLGGLTNIISAIPSTISGLLNKNQQNVQNIRNQNQSLTTPIQGTSFRPQIAGLTVPTINAVGQSQALASQTQPQFSSFTESNVGANQPLASPIPQTPIPQISTPPQVNPPITQPQQQQNNFQPQLDALLKQAQAIQTSLSGLQQQPQLQQSTEAENALLAAQQQSPEEKAAQERLDQLAGQFRLGQENIQDQPIALEFITGQKSALERRAAALSEPIERQIARLQAERGLQLEQAKTRFGIEKSKQGEIKEVGGNLVRIRPDGSVETIFEGPREAAKPVTVSPGASLVDPSTGEAIFTAPRQQTETEIAKSLEKTEKDESARFAQGQTLSTINSILADPNLELISGVSRFGIRARIATTASVRSQLQQLKAMTSLENREKLKGTGAVSDFEATMLAESANALNSAIEEDGRIAMTDTDARRHLQNIKGLVALRSGNIVPAEIYNPETGETIQANITKQEFIDLSQDGNVIDFL